MQDRKKNKQITKQASHPIDDFFAVTMVFLASLWTLIARFLALFNDAPPQNRTEYSRIKTKLQSSTLKILESPSCSHKLMRRHSPSPAASPDISEQDVETKNPPLITPSTLQNILPEEEDQPSLSKRMT